MCALVFFLFHLTRLSHSNAWSGTASWYIKFYLTTIFENKSLMKILAYLFMSFYVTTLANPTVLKLNMMGCELSFVP